MVSEMARSSSIIFFSLCEEVSYLEPFSTLRRYFAQRHLQHREANGLTSLGYKPPAPEDKNLTQRVAL